MLTTKRIVRKNLRKSEFVYARIDVRRVSKTTKGGRTMSVSVSVVIGDQNGVIGFGKGNAADVSSAEQKALQNAQKNLFKVPLKKVVTDSSVRYTIHHAVTGYSSGASVNLMSAKPGISLACSSVIRDICYVLGITDLVSKIHKSTNRNNVAQAAILALQNIKTPLYYKLLSKSVSTNNV